MRILHVSEALGGGVLAVLQPLLAQGADAGHEMILAYGVRPETPEDRSGMFDSRVSVLPPVWSRRSLGSQLIGIRRLRAIVRDAKPDLIHAHSSFAGLAAVASSAGVPVIYTPHGYAFLRRDIGGRRRTVFRLLERIVARRATLVAGCSGSEAAEARRIGAPRVGFVTNGIAELDFPVEPRDLRWSPPLVVAGGRISPQRQPAACARILGAVADVADVRWIGGAGEGDVHLEALEAASIETTGWLPRSACLAALESAAVYLHWSGWDGLPLSILEAMASDTVVVASDIAPNRELLAPRQICRTEEEAVALVRSVLADPVLRASMLADQRLRAEQFGARRMCNEWIRLYERSPGGSRPTADAVQPVLANGAPASAWSADDGSTDGSTSEDERVGAREPAVGSRDR